MTERDSREAGLSADQFAALIGLRDAFPDWEVWTVPTFDGRTRGLVWCARRRADRTVLRHADTANWLASELHEFGVSL